MSGNNERILIVGAGPVGLMCAFILAQAGVQVEVFEQNSNLVDDPRAATTHPATLELLSRIGVVDEVQRLGLIAPVFQFWDRPSGQLIAEFDHALLEDETDFPFVVQCEQFKLTRIFYSQLRSLDHVEVHFNAKAVGLEVGEHEVSLTIENPEGREIFQGCYLVGADGGRSFVRKALGLTFEGFTWEERFIVLSTSFDFEAARGCAYRSYFADPTEWCNCFKVSGDGPPGLWRTVYPADLDTTEEELLGDESVQKRLHGFWPIQGDYDLVHRNLYQVHQRVAERFRLGRVLLAGDAAHVNNPIGGLGLNGGLQDAANLSEKLIEVFYGRSESHLLDLYDLQRRTVISEHVQRQTIENKKRLEAHDPEARQAYLTNLRKTAEDPVRAKEFLMQTAMIKGQRRAASITLDGP